VANAPTVGSTGTDEDTSIMTPADEATFIALWNEGLESAEIGRQLCIPRGTVSSRAKRLVAQGKIQPRQRGGAYPKQRALARSEAEGGPSTLRPGS
jgi:hypothetical protein